LPLAQYCLVSETLRSIASLPLPATLTLGFAIHSQTLSLFVSPLRDGCSQRFVFNGRGEIKPAIAGDPAAEETIRRLGLCDSALTALRQAAIRGALNPRSQPLRLSQAQRLLSQMRSAAETVDRGGSARLADFCFAIEQALENHIKKFEPF